MAHESDERLIYFEEKLFKIKGIYNILWAPLTYPKRIPFKLLQMAFPLG
jgi:hypothetical protein